MAAHIGFKESFASLAVRHNGNVKSQRWKSGPDVMKFPPGVPQTAFTRTAQTGHHTDL